MNTSATNPFGQTQAFVPPPKAAAGPPPTEKQVAFLIKLAGERPTWAKEHGLDSSTIPQLNRSTCSRHIDEALKQPREAAADEITEDGMYRTPAGVIFKVQWNQSHTRLYAKRLTKLDEPIVMKTKTKTHEFEYAPGGLRNLTPAMKMTLDEAKEWGALYGTCCVCGAELTNEASIEAGIGPVCAAKF